MKSGRARLILALEVRWPRSDQIHSRAADPGQVSGRVLGGGSPDSCLSRPTAREVVTPHDVIPFVVKSQVVRDVAL